MNILMPKALTADASPTIDDVMSQAQVFACAWSMVGGPFDNGDGMQNATTEKLLLREMLAKSLYSPPVRAAIALRQNVEKAISDYQVAEALKAELTTAADHE
jgi:hypothetical protein